MSRLHKHSRPIYFVFDLIRVKDIWALGVFLYKLCFYTTPFEEQGPLAILNVQYKMPSYPNYSADMRALIASLLLESTTQRPTAYQIHLEVCRLRGVQPKTDYVRRIWALNFAQILLVINKRSDLVTSNSSASTFGTSSGIE